ncbi:MAG: protein translocase subunit SecD, partial [Gammaproteobacteria bacterium]|nr:protein translocase subunit SecD [Gammaproteobacteria bacterium]
MNQYPLWRYLLVLVVLITGILYAAPNLYGQAPSLQISARRAAPVDESLEKSVTSALEEAKVPWLAVERTDKRLLIRFPDDAARAAGMPVVSDKLGTKDYLVALNLAPATPVWLRDLGAKPMYMGLDLRGGVHFLMQVDTDAVQRQLEDRFIAELRAAFREEKVRFRTVSRSPSGGVLVTFLNADALAAGTTILDRDFVDLEASETGS